MKRLNPNTNKPFKGGEIRPDGFIFKVYKKTLNRDGYFNEQWLDPKVNKKFNEIQKKRTHRKRQQAYRGSHLKRRLNPLTDKEYKLGDRDEKKRYFVCYRSYSYNNKLFYEEWAREPGWHSLHVSAAVSSAKKRAKKINFHFL